MANRGNVAAVATAPVAVPRQVQLNPERAPALIAKWQKLLGKDLDRIEVIYKADGVTVDLYELVNGAVPVDEDGEEITTNIASFKAKRQEAAKPTAEEALQAFKNKFELRLNREFPSKDGPKDGSDPAIQSWLNNQPFNIRRAMLMSGKQFKSAYPNGFPAA